MPTTHAENPNTKMKVLKEAALYLVHFVVMVIHKMTAPIFAWKFEGQRQQRLPPLKDTILEKSATQIAKMIRQSKVTCVVVVEAFIDRIKEVNPILNAVVAERFGDALQQAREVDSMLKSKQIPEEYSEENAPFLGVPFTAKEAFGVVGMPNTSGLLTRRGVVATKDAVVVSLLEKAGAIPVALTNCSELCMWMESSNLLYGRTNNAYHPGRMVGGSSGGEGCILSAAGSVIGVGSDVGGSIRLPSYFNGVFGHRPTQCVVDNTGQFPNGCGLVKEYLVTGPMCRYAEDLLPMLDIMAGEGRHKLNLQEPISLSDVKVFFMLDNGGGLLSSPVDAQIQASILKAAEHLGTVTGTSAKKVHLSLLNKSIDIWSALMGASGNEKFCSLMGRGNPVNPASELLRWLLGCPRHTLPAIGLGLLEKVPFPESEVERLRAMTKKLQDEFRALLGGYGVLLYPTCPTVALYHNQAITLPFNWNYTAIFNVLGLPCTQVPMGIGKEGVPVGFQVVGNFHRDHVPIAVARELERAFGGWVPPF